MSVYAHKPKRFLNRLWSSAGDPIESVCCAGFQLKKWRCEDFASHLVEWLPDYALPEEELNVTHGNMYVKLKQAAIRVYTSENYDKRGEAGEIAIHAVCRDFFGTIPIAPRVFYKSSSNDVVKGFDMVHARFHAGKTELWFGESKLYLNSIKAIKDAIASVAAHLEEGFLKNQKLLIGPQISKSSHYYDDLLSLFEPQTSLDYFLDSSVFVIGILANSKSAGSATNLDSIYQASIKLEYDAILNILKKSPVLKGIKILLLYIPLGSKTELVKAFDHALKGLQ